MDTEIRSALRWLGRGFQAKRFDTISLLKALGLERIYVVTGIFTGFFFSLEELEKAIKEADLHISVREMSNISAWLADSKRPVHFFQHLNEPATWSGPSWEDRDGGAYLCIKTFDLNAPQSLDCCGNSANVQISDFLLCKEGCPSCGGGICISHVMMCQECDKDICVACCVINDATIARGTDMMCLECAQEAGIELEPLTDTSKDTQTNADTA